MENLFTDLPSSLPDELFTTLLEANNLRIERIVSDGHSSPEGFCYDQDQHEWVVVLQGATRLSIEGNRFSAGDAKAIVASHHSRNWQRWWAKLRYREAN